MTCISCTDEVRRKVPSFQNVTPFLHVQYKILHRDVIHLHFCLFEDVTDCSDLRKNKLQKFFFNRTLRFFEDNHYQSFIIEIQMKACNLHTTTHYCRRFIISGGGGCFSRLFRLTASLFQDGFKPFFNFYLIQFVYILMIISIFVNDM